MRGPGRVLALVAAVAAILVVSCGLAPVGGPALVPAAPLQTRTDAARFEPALARAPGVATAVVEPVLHKVVLPEPVVATKPALPAASLKMKHVWQSLNNCGPASVVMLLSSLGVDTDQETARVALRGTNWARGMGPGPVDPWVKEQFGVRATWRTNGTNTLIKALISNGFAPMVTQWLEDPSVSRISHWRVVQGYDDARGVFSVYDPLRGRIALTYEWFEKNWQPFSYRYLVIHRPEDEAVVKALLGAAQAERAAHDRALEHLRSLRWLTD